MSEPLERHYFGDRRRALALWSHALGLGDGADVDAATAGIHAVFDDARQAGRLPELAVGVMTVALGVCPSLRSELARQVPAELLATAHAEAEEAHTNRIGWDIDPGSGDGTDWLRSDE
ncbi:hypothetical protein [Nocardia nova]|uniref:hypothetical protein n=1 Tax=Nocardia nova TaxID=37330 RepID=UPI001895B784|nr:hypothetical protein [Nocardia nova]MBF6144235.1 hypothetical protein [Nocardia nova]